MKKSAIWGMVAAMLSVAVMSYGEVISNEGEVIANLLNARLRPTVKSPVVLKLKKGDKVRILAASENNWLELAVPEQAMVYVSEAYVVGGKAHADTQMRAGKGTNFPSWGVLKKGEPVKLLDDRAYGWVRIVPPERLRIFALGLFVKGEVPQTKSEAEKPAAVETPAAPAAEAKSEAEKPAAVETPAAPAAEVKSEAVKQAEKTALKPAEKSVTEQEAAPKVKSAAVKVKPVTVIESVKPDAVLAALGVDEKSSGAPVRLSGTLTAVSSSKSMATNYALMGDKSNLGFIYDSGKTGVLKKLENSAVTLDGTAFKVPGWRAPVVLLRSISPAK